MLEFGSPATASGRTHLPRGGFAVASRLERAPPGRTGALGPPIETIALGAAALRPPVAGTAVERSAPATPARPVVPAGEATPLAGLGNESVALRPRPALARLAIEPAPAGPSAIVALGARRNAATIAPAPLAASEATGGVATLATREPTTILPPPAGREPAALRGPLAAGETAALASATSAILAAGDPAPATIPREPAAVFPATPALRLGAAASRRSRRPRRAQTAARTLAPSARPIIR